MVKNAPHHLANMAVFETPDHRRILIRSDIIRVIEALDPGEGSTREGAQ